MASSSGGVSAIERESSNRGFEEVLPRYEEGLAKEEA